MPDAGLRAAEEILDRLILERTNPRVVGAPWGRGLEREVALAVPDAGRAPETGEYWIRLDRLYPEEEGGLRDAYGPPRVHAFADAVTGERSALVHGPLHVLLREAERLASRPETDEAGLAVRWVLADFSTEPARLALPGGKSIDLSRGPVVMGILNVTPDSFSDGGEFLDPERALERALAMREAGAGIVDVGGMSTRPGSDPVPEEEELARVLPVLERIQRVPGWDVPVSIDTFRSEVARRALAAGATIVNDVSGLLSDPATAKVVAEAGAAVVVMHMQGTPRTMQADPAYEDLMGEIVSLLRDSIGLAERAGVARDSIVVDPGIGFGKRPEHNLEILDRLWELRSLGLPILVGTSRKSFIGKTLGRPLPERLFGTAATVALAVARGARIVRVHDVAPMADVARMAWAVCRGET